MFIKKVTIRNFKSYRNETVFDDFSPRLNLLVGENGSGKTNFLEAVMFALGRDVYKCMRGPTRRNALHDSSVSGSVEIVFGSRDVLLEETVLSLKREISSTDDNFFINGKKVSKESFHETLEDVAFPIIGSRHLYVKQGALLSMVTASDAEHLQQLLNIADISTGNKEFETELEANSREYEYRMEKINSISSMTKNYIRTLEKREKKLKNYSDWVERQQYLKYLLHNRQLQKEMEEMIKLEGEKRTLEEELGNHKYELREAWEKKRRTLSHFRDCQITFQTTDKEFDTLYKELDSVSVARRKLSLVVCGLTDQILRCRDLKEEAEGKLSIQNDTIKQVRDQLEEVNSSLEKNKQEEDKVILNLAVMQRRTVELYAKQDRLERVTSKDERDQEIRTKLESLDKQMRAELNNQRKYKKDMRKYATKIKSLTAESEGLMPAMDLLRGAVLESSTEFLESKKKRDQQKCKTRDLRKKTVKPQCRLLSLKEELRTLDEQFCKVEGKDVLDGQKSVNIVLDFWKSNGGQMANLAETSYHGMVIDNFDCSWEFYVPVYVTGGKRLFFHIVDSSKIADAIMKEVERQKLPGRIKFLYLNRVCGVDQTYPQVQGVYPLISKLEYEPKYEKALKMIFGRTLICLSFKESTWLVNKFGFNCVNKEGEMVSSKGLVTSGGVFGRLPTIPEIHKFRRSLKEEVDNLEKKLEKDLEVMTQENEILDNLVVETDALKDKFTEAQFNFDFQLRGKLIHRVESLRGEISRLETDKAATNNELARCDVAIAVMRTAIEALEAELLEELTVDLPVEDQQHLNLLLNGIFSINQTREQALDKRVQVEAEKDRLVQQLEDSLCRRDDLILDLLRKSVNYKEELSRQKSYDLAVVTANEQETEEALEEVKGSLRTASEELKTEQQVREMCIAEEKIAQERLEKVTNEFVSLADTCFEQRCKVQSLHEMVFKLERPPKNKLKQYLGWNTKMLFEELKKLESRVKKYSPLIEKSVDDLNYLLQKPRTMKKKARKVKNCRLLLQRIFDGIKTREKEFFETTFQQLRHHFSETFEKLNPEGTADLILKTADEEERTSAAGLDYDDCVGLAFRESFDQNGWLGEMCEFSRGQQTVIAIALIFALHECHPLPFILLDEVDQSLAQPYTDAFYDLMKTLSKKTQFIATSFKPGLLSYADQIYGVELQNMMSYAEPVDRVTASKFLQRGVEADRQ